MLRRGLVWDVGGLGAGRGGEEGRVCVDVRICCKSDV